MMHHNCIRILDFKEKLLSLVDDQSRLQINQNINHEKYFPTHVSKRLLLKNKKFKSRSFKKRNDETKNNNATRGTIRGIRVSLSLCQLEIPNLFHIEQTFPNTRAIFFFNFYFSFTFLVIIKIKNQNVTCYYHRNSKSMFEMILMIKIVLHKIKYRPNVNP